MCHHYHSSVISVTSLCQWPLATRVQYRLLTDAVLCDVILSLYWLLTFLLIFIYSLQSSINKSTEAKVGTYGYNIIAHTENIQYNIRTKNSKHNNFKVKCIALTEMKELVKIWRLISGAGNKRFNGQFDSVWQIKNQWGSIRPWSSRLVASHFTAYNSSDHERKLRMMVNEMFFLLSYLRHCAFTANPKEITVNNFASTCDSADHSS